MLEGVDGRREEGRWATGTGCGVCLPEISHLHVNLVLLMRIHCAEYPSIAKLPDSLDRVLAGEAGKNNSSFVAAVWQGGLVAGGWCVVVVVFVGRVKARAQQ